MKIKSINTIYKFEGFLFLFKSKHVHIYKLNDENLKNS